MDAVFQQHEILKHHDLLHYLLEVYDYIHAYAGLVCLIIGIHDTCTGWLPLLMTPPETVM